MILLKVKADLLFQWFWREWNMSLEKDGGGQGGEIFPIQPQYHPVHKFTRLIYDFLASAKLALALLIVILACCLTGVTVYRGKEAWQVIFNTLWFNSLLVLLVVNVACCFFGRIWRRKITIVSFGMILFHMSFVMVFLAIVYNSLFYFRGVIRLTEGEVLASDNPESYDTIEKGRFFSFSRLSGETRLIKMHTGYNVDGKDKRWAYEVEVGDRDDRTHGIIYITHKLTHNGFDYFNEKEGFSLALELADLQGRPVYGAYLPLQSIEQPDGSYVYATGYREGLKVKASPILFPPYPGEPLYAMQVAYKPPPTSEQRGNVELQLFRLDANGKPRFEVPLVNGTKRLGDKFMVDNLSLAADEVRYWVAMMVRYEPGKPILLTSLWFGLLGMTITTVGRMFRKTVKK